jgi:hypothetical protein
MSDEGSRTDRGLADTGRQLTGLYRLGFDPESFIGFILPWLIVGAIGGIGALVILYWL